MHETGQAGRQSPHRTHSGDPGSSLILISTGQTERQAPQETHRPVSTRMVYRLILLKKPNMVPKGQVVRQKNLGMTTEKPL